MSRRTILGLAAAAPGSLLESRISGPNRNPLHQKALKARGNLLLLFVSKDIPPTPAHGPEMGEKTQHIEFFTKLNKLNL